MDTHTQLILIGYITAMLITARTMYHYDHALKDEPLLLFIGGLLWPIIVACLTGLTIIAAFNWAATGHKPWK